MASIKFDNQEILNTTYVPRFVKHESDPEININMLELARDDGSIIVSERNGVKKVLLQGILTAATQSALETAIDSFKELFRRVNKNLDVSWESGTRRYVATCTKHEFDRDHFHLLFVPWTAEFTVPAGVGEATSEATLYDADFTTQNKLLGYAGYIVFGGTARPKPRIRISNKGTNSSDAAGIEVKNSANGDRIVYTRYGGLQGFDTGLEIDERLKTVKYGGSVVGWFGVMPKIDVGSAATYLYVKIGDIVATGFYGSTSWDSEMPCYGNGVVKPAQSFMVPYADSTFQGISVLMRRNGTPGTDLTWRIETDNAGKPSGSLAAGDAYGTISAAVFTDTYFDWRLNNSTNKFSLAANTRYWLVLNTTGGDGSNYYAWSNHVGVGATYKNGNLDYQSGVGSWLDLPANDADFYILFGGKFDGTKTYHASVYQTYRYL